MSADARYPELISGRTLAGASKPPVQSSVTSQPVSFRFSQHRKCVFKWLDLITSFQRFPPSNTTTSVFIAIV